MNNLYEETATHRIYVVDGFYLVIPKLLVGLDGASPDIYVAVDDYIDAEKKEAYFKSTNILIIRMYENGYFSDINDPIESRKLRSIINVDVLNARKFLRDNGIPFSDGVRIITDYLDFKDWYEKDEYFSSLYKKILQTNSNPEDSLKNTPDMLPTKEKLKILKAQILSDYNVEKEASSEEVFSGDTNESQSMGGNVKKLIHPINAGNPHSRLVSDTSLIPRVLKKEFKDGFFNVVFLSIISLIVTVGTIIMMLSIYK